MRRSLLADETGFIVSSELVLIATILVIGLIVGMSEVQHAVVGELNDVADAIGSANQSYSYSGFTKRDRGWGWGAGWGWGGVHAYTAGSMFVDLQDACDLNQCMLACNPPVIEAPKSAQADMWVSRRFRWWPFRQFPVLVSFPFRESPCRLFRSRMRPSRSFPSSGSSRPGTAVHGLPRSCGGQHSDAGDPGSGCAAADSRHLDLIDTTHFVERSTARLEQPGCWR